jgi:hypothetical protein
MPWVSLEKASPEKDAKGRQMRTPRIHISSKGPTYVGRVPAYWRGARILGGRLHVGRGVRMLEGLLHMQ